MSRSQPSLEVTSALLGCAKATGFKFRADTALVAVQHMLRQTVDLFHTMSEMGLPVNNIFALGKVYSNSFPVIETLREMGVTIIDSSVPKPGEFHYYFQHDIKRLWEVVSESLGQRREIQRVLILDDAGVCVTNVPAEILRQYAVCAVEQTSSGIFLFEETAPPLAVISWARAAVKLEIGGPIFSHSFIEKLNTQFLHGRSLEAQPIGILGLGSIGKGIANLALRQGSEVLFYDPGPGLQIPSTLKDSITRVSSLEELMLRSEFVVGCTGRNPYKGNWPLEHKPGLKLLSVSGGDQEFGPLIDYLKDKPDFKVDPHTWDITSAYGPSGPIQIAYLGYPYNFVRRGQDAVPAQIVQLETGGLLVALVQAQMFLDLCENDRQDNSGIHRVSPEAQRFVYERWLAAMNARGIDTDVFGLDLETRQAAQHDSWFIENSEPAASLNTIDDLMNGFVCRGSRSVNASEEA